MKKAIGVNFLSNIGDCVVSWSAITALKKAFPDIEIDVIVSNGEKKLYELCADVNQLYTFQKKRKGFLRSLLNTYDEFKLCRKIAKQDYDCGFVFDLKDASVAKLFTINPKIKAFRNGSKLANIISKVLKKRSFVRNCDAANGRTARWLDVLSEAGVSVDYSCRANIEVPLAAQVAMNKKLSLRVEDRIFVICPFGSTNSRFWSIENYRAVIDFVEKTNCFDRIFVVGVDKNRQDLSDIVEGNSAQSLINCLNIVELAALLHCSELFLTVDTGPMHIADALNKELIALYPFCDKNFADWKVSGNNSVVIISEKQSQRNNGFNISLSQVIDEINNKIEKTSKGQSDGY
ncbi:MAG: glycosyltransferase family 9 protein [Negativicutes bacterium]|jgi:ADP-heptose:LPS heptosyltransferase